MADNSAAIGVAIFLSLAAFVVALISIGADDIGPGGEDEAARGPRTFEVQMRSIKYAPLELTVQVGDTVRWINGDAVGHTVTPTDKAHWGTQGSGDSGGSWLLQGDSWSFTFNEPGTYEYFCIPHASKDASGVYQGMTGKIIVTEQDVEGPDEEADEKPAPAKAVEVAEIGANASLVPPSNDADHVFVNITSREVVAAMADGITYTYWTFDGQVPGRMLRVKEGALVTVNFTNAADSTVGHNIDFHAATGPGGGAAVLSAFPGESKQLTFRALKPGLYVYHCAYQDPPLHVAHGMYGLLLVEPKDGLPPVDREFYVMQGDFYSDFPGSLKGHHEHSETAADAEEPSFVVFNGRVGSLRDAGRYLHAEVNETVRIHFGVGGPNLASSFHVIGEIFDRVYQQGDVITDPAEGLQTTLVPAGGATIVDFRLEVPGDYLLVDHSLYRVHKGAAGILHVTGPGNPDVFHSEAPGDGSGH